MRVGQSIWTGFSVLIAPSYPATATKEKIVEGGTYTPVADGTLVRYYGSLPYLSGEQFVVSRSQPDHISDDTESQSCDKHRYSLTPVIAGIVNRSYSLDYIWNVRRQSFVVADG